MFPPLRCMNRICDYMVATVIRMWTFCKYLRCNPTESVDSSQTSIFWNIWIAFLYDYGFHLAPSTRFVKNKLILFRTTRCKNVRNLNSRTRWGQRVLMWNAFTEFTLRLGATNIEQVSRLNRNGFTIGRTITVRNEHVKTDLIFSESSRDL